VDAWTLEPARDLELSGMARFSSVRRESGLAASLGRLVFWSGIRLGLGLLHRLEIRGREYLPATPPFVLAANHASHLDALVLGAALGLRWRDRLFPLAAGDTFFHRRETAAFAAAFLNALPVWRREGTGRGVRTLRQRLLEESCVYVLFPEGTRSRDGRMGTFKAGIGMLVAGTTVPVVPCHLQGTFAALPPHRVVPRPTRISLQFGAPLEFAATTDDRSGWRRVANTVETSVRQIAAGRCVVNDVQ
jgi:1-acyl-sn-glycerol-3-phosphate acyltransferase